jgi:hypothetical protein
MEYAIFALAIFLMFSLIGVILYVCWLFNYGVEEYRAGKISVRGKIGVSLKPYNREIGCILAACKNSRFMVRVLDDAAHILDQTCIVMTENLYADGRKCIGIAKRVGFMGLPGQQMRRYMIFLDLGSIRSKALSYEQIEGLIRHEFAYHFLEVMTGQPDPHHTNELWSKI